MMTENEGPNEISQFASNVLQILPIMSELYELADSLKGKEITSTDKVQVQRLTRELRAKAAEVGLLPTVEDELRGLDMDVVRDKFARLIERLPEGEIWQALAEQVAKELTLDIKHTEF